MPRHLSAGGGNAINQHRMTADGFIAKSQTNIPANIVCFVCKKSKPRGEYANRQIQKFVDTIHNHHLQAYAPRGRTMTNPKTTCKSCTPQQVSNLTCVICTKTKPLTKFAKSQRKTPHEARCERCVQMHLQTEPDFEPPDSEEYADSDSDVVCLYSIRPGPNLADKLFGKQDGDFDGAENQKPMAPGGSDGGASPVGFRDDCASGYAVSTTTEGIYDEDGWEAVPSAGSRRPIAGQPPLPSLHATASAARPSAARSSAARSSATTTSTTTKKNSWAKPDKSGDAKWGQNAEADVWDQYARELGARRDATMKLTKKKKPIVESSDEENLD